MAGFSIFWRFLPGLAIALFLNQNGPSGIRLYKSLFFFPFVISQVVVGLVFTWFYDPTFGLAEPDAELFSDLGPRSTSSAIRKLVTYGIIAAGLWPQTAYCMILYLTGLNAVDPEQVEAARLDGAKGSRMLWYVIIPQLRPATFIAFVVTIIGALRSFDLISIMTNGGPFGQSRVLSFYMFEKSALGIWLPHGLWRGHRCGSVPDHALFHRLFPVVDVPRRKRRTLRCFPRPIQQSSRAWQTTYQALVPAGADHVAFAAHRCCGFLHQAGFWISPLAITGGMPSSFQRV